MSTSTRNNRGRKTAFLLLALLFLGCSVQGQQWLDELDNKLSLKSKDGLFGVDLTGLWDLEGYYVDQRPPGLLYEDESFLNYRLTFFTEAQLGTHFYAFLQAR